MALSVISQDGTVGGGDLYARATGATNNSNFGVTGTGATNLLGHIEDQISGATAPVVHAATCGTSPSITPGSTDNAFEIVVGTGGTATSCQVDFGKVFAKTTIVHPICTATSETDMVALKVGYITGASMTVTAAAAFTASGKISVNCW